MVAAVARPTVAVVGGGISGLSLAYFLRQALPRNAKILVLEAAPKVGGWVQTANQAAVATDPTQTFQFEHGPRGFRPSRNGAEVLRLVEQLNLQEHMLTVDASAKTRYILRHGKVEQLPTSLWQFLMWPLALEAGKAIRKDLRTPPSKADDESVYDFIARRFSPVLAEALVDPMCSGICGGDIHKLSIRSFFPALYEKEQQHGSVIRGMMSKKKQTEAEKMLLLDGSTKSAFVQQYENARSVSFQGGMQTIIQALEQELKRDDNASISTDSKVVDIARNDGHDGFKLQVQRSGESPTTIDTSHVFSTIPAFRLAESVHRSAPVLADALRTIKFADMATMCVGFNAPVLKHPGFGYLIPSSEQEKVLGVVFDSNSFPTQNAPAYPRQTRLSIMAGGAHHPEIAQLRKDQLETLALDALRRHLDITEPPDFVDTVVLKNAIPQYHVGFHKTLKQIESNLPPGLQLGGNSFCGVGVTDCIARSKELALQFSRQVASSHQ